LSHSRQASSYQHISSLASPRSSFSCTTLSSSG
jgi:hypothetical protein